MCGRCDNWRVIILNGTAHHTHKLVYKSGSSVTKSWEQQIFQLACNTEIDLARQCVFLLSNKQIEDFPELEIAGRKERNQ